MDWTRISKWLDIPVEKLKASFSRKPTTKLSEWEARMEAQTKELDRLAKELREVVERRKVVFEKIRDYDEQAERALRDGDEQGAKALLMKKQDWAKLAEEGKKESAAWLEAVRVAKERLERTRAESEEILREEPPDPDAPKVRVKL